jgi:hypothetical protein
VIKKIHQTGIMARRGLALAALFLIALLLGIGHVDALYKVSCGGADVLC